MTIESPSFPDPTAHTSNTHNQTYENQVPYEYNEPVGTSPSTIYYDSGMAPRRAKGGAGFLTLVGLFIFSLSFLFYSSNMMILLQSIGIGLCCVGGIIGINHHYRQYRVG